MTGEEQAAHVLVVGGWDAMVGTFTGLPAFVTLVQEPNRLTSLQRDVAGRVRAQSFDDVNGLLSWAHALHAEHPVSACVSLTERGLLPAAMVRSALGLPGPSAEVARLGIDKSAMRERMRAAGIATLRHQVCQSLTELEGFAAATGTAIIAKPNRGSGSEGVTLTHSDGDLKAAWEYASGAASDGVVLAEECAMGAEYSVETFSVGGRHTVLAVTSKLTEGPPGFVEIGHVLPVRHVREEALISGATGVLDAIGYTDGPAHTEVIDSGDAVHVIEVNLRVGGDRIWELVEIATGVSLVRATAIAAVGGASPMTRVNGRKLSERVAAIRYLDRRPLSGHTERVELVNRLPGVIRAVVTDICQSGATRLTSSDDRAGYVIAVAGSEECAVERAAAGARLLQGGSP